MSKITRREMLGKSGVLAGASIMGLANEELQAGEK